MADDTTRDTTRGALVRTGEGSHLATRDRPIIPPALAYVGRQRSPEGRRVAYSRLVTASRMLSGGRLAPEVLAWHEVTGAHVSALVSALTSPGARSDGGTYSGAAVNGVLAAVRGAIREAWRAGMMTADARDRALDVRAERTPATPSGRMLATGEVRALFDHAAHDGDRDRGARSAAMLAVAFGAGLRVAEAASLGRGDVDLDAREVSVTRGKGRKARAVPLPAGAVEALGAWLPRRDAILRSQGEDPSSGALFVGLTGAHRGRAMTPGGCYRAMMRLALEAGVGAVPWHDARRTYVSTLLDAGADVLTVGRLAGHSNPATTRRYDLRPARAARDAADLLHVPYSRPRWDRAR